MAKKDKKVKDFLEHLNTVPNISLACEKVGLARNTIYRWCKEDKEFQRSVDLALSCGADSIIDLAESKLISHINNGSLRAIQYYLDNHKKEYMRPRIAVDSKDQSEPISYIEIHPVDPNNLPPSLPLNDLDLPLDHIG